MKLHFSPQIGTSINPSSSVLPKNNSSQTFGTILQEQINKTQQTDSSVSSIQASSRVVSMQSTQIPAGSVVQQIGGLLDTLEAYQEKLADPAVSHEELAPSVERLKQEQQALEPVLESIKDNNELKALLNQSLITASNEVIRYGRGDYYSE